MKLAAKTDEEYDAKATVEGLISHSVKDVSNPGTSDFEILFKDSPEYFYVKGARMIQEGALIRFICFKDGNFDCDHWYPIVNIHRIKKS